MVSSFTGPVVQAMSRIYAREVAVRIAGEGLRWLFGAQEGVTPGGLENALNLEAIYSSQRGLLADSDLVAQALRES